MFLQDNPTAAFRLSFEHAGNITTKRYDTYPVQLYPNWQRMRKSCPHCIVGLWLLCPHGQSIIANRIGREGSRWCATLSDHFVLNYIVKPCFFLNSLTHVLTHPATGRALKKLMITNQNINLQLLCAESKDFISYIWTHVKSSPFTSISCTQMPLNLKMDNASGHFTQPDIHLCIWTAKPSFHLATLFTQPKTPQSEIPWPKNRCHISSRNASRPPSPSNQHLWSIIYNRPTTPDYDH